MRDTVLFITPTFAPLVGGSEVFTDKLLTYASAKGHRVVLITCTLFRRPTRLRDARSSNYIIYRLPVIVEWFCGWSSLRFFLNYGPPMFVAAFFYCLFNFWRIKVIHTNSSVSGVIGLVLGKVFRIKTVCTTHGLNFNSEENRKEYTPYAKLMGFIYRNQDVIFAGGQVGIDELVSLRVDPKRILKFTHWADLQRFRPVDGSELRRTYVSDERQFLCLYVGRFEESKGVLETLAAIRLLKAEGHTDIKFLFLGFGTHEPAVRRAQEETGLIADIKLVDNTELPKYYSAADVSLIPSTWHGESYNLVLIEAIACGCAVIASKAGAMDEALHMDGDPESKVGISVTTVNARSLADAILSLHRDRALLKRYRANGADYAQRYFSERNIDYMLKQYP